MSRSMRHCPSLLFSSLLSSSLLFSPPLSSTVRYLLSPLYYYSVQWTVKHFIHARGFLWTVSHLRVCHKIRNDMTRNDTLSISCISFFCPTNTRCAINYSHLIESPTYTTLASNYRLLSIISSYYPRYPGDIRSSCCDNTGPCPSIRIEIFLSSYGHRCNI